MSILFIEKVHSVLFITYLDIRNSVGNDLDRRWNFGVSKILVPPKINMPANSDKYNFFLGNTRRFCNFYKYIEIPVAVLAYIFNFYNVIWYNVGLRLKNFPSCTCGFYDENFRQYQRANFQIILEAGMQGPTLLNCKSILISLCLLVTH